MNKDITLYLTIGIIIGIIFGVILASILNPKFRNYKRIKKELETTQLQLANQKQLLVKHFSHSAGLLDKMAKDFRRLYQHMAENSTSFLADVDLNDPRYAITDFENKEGDCLEIPENKEQPKDYPSNPSGLLKKGKSCKH